MQNAAYKNKTANEGDSGNAAETAKRTARSPKVEVPFSERAAYTLNEFAALFGKQTVWGYRQMYAGRIKVIKTLGRMMVPRSEVERLQNSAEILN